MSQSAIRQIIDSYSLPPREKYILIIYTRFSDKDGNGAYPSVKTVSKKSGYGETTVRECYAILEQAGLMTRKGMTDKQTIIWDINTKWNGKRKDVESVKKDQRAGRVTRYPSDTVEKVARQTGDTVARQTGDNDHLTKLNNNILTDYQKLLTAFINSSKIAMLGEIKPRDNDSLVKMVDAGVLPCDIEEAVKYSTQNNLSIIGPSSIERGAGIAKAKRDRMASTENRLPDKVGNRPLPKGV